MNFQAAVVTGASAGIGEALAVQLAEQKTNLLLVARNQSRLKTLAERLRSQHRIECHVLAADLSKAGEARRVREWCEQNKFPVDALINNAGVGQWGELDEKNLFSNLATIDLNVRGLTELTGEFFPLLKLRPSAVLHVASTAAFQAIPTFAVYAATKAYTLSFSRALHHEWKKHGISVTALCPGPTKTEFMKKAHISHLDKLAEIFSMDAASVARVGLKGLAQKKREVIPGYLNWLTSKIVQFAPRTPSEIVSGKFFR
jgi:short-subunit dehydrogenase